MTQQRKTSPRRNTAKGLWAAYLVAFAVTATAAAAADPRLPAADASDPRETPLVQAVKKAKASVVNIHSVKTSYDEASVFGSKQGRKVNGMGTGIVVDGRGYIVTNNHVVAGVESLRCSLVDGSSYDATTVAVDPEHDLAIIKVEPTRDLTVMPLGTSSDIMLGETVVAVGNAFGYEHTVTAGIVSALHRDVEVNETQSYKNLIQTDASINPGNSGGPLLNLRGEVVGINVAIRAGAQRIGFAIPIDDARQIIAKLFNTEAIDRTAHGLITEDVKNAEDRRLIVRGAATASPASQAGFQPGDVLIQAEGKGVVDRVDLERALLGHKAGQSIEIVVHRDGEPKTLSLTLGATTAPPRNVIAAAQTVQTTNEADSAWTVLGLKLGTAGTEAVVGTRYRGGLRVSAVREGGPAAASGIRAGDVLVGLDQWETVTPDHVEWVLKRSPLKTFSSLKFYILGDRGKGQETLLGHLKLASPR
ncbi:MAG: trypsin-like peptidase domain-containing protein [Planctomycetaceae bacterium]|nr:trypsin-like peptidase domain-containing protein [Planctomycetaceae bacterium]